MRIFDQIVSYVIRNKGFVLIAGLAVLAYGIYSTAQTSVDILPDLNRPTVTVFTEAEGYASEEVEQVVTVPIESVMNGAPGVERVRSVSTAGLSLVFVEFAWDQEILTARQIVGEKLNAVSLPEGAETVLGPISSIMGEIQLVGINSKNDQTSPEELRSIADWVIRPKLLTVPGVSKVTAIGGAVQEYQIKIDPVALSNIGLSIIELEEKVRGIADNTSGGFIATDSAEFPVRIIGRTDDVKLLENTVVAVHEDTRILLKDVARVVVGAPVAPRGDAGINGKTGVILSITKQPGVNTLKLTREIDSTLHELSKSLSDDIKVHTDLFKQEKFIQNGINNVVGASRDAAILVVVILLLFLGNVRALGITLVALPFSFIVAILILRSFGIGINVMTLGGLAVAIGELTDDAVVGVENTVRWLKENKKKGRPLPVAEVVLRASSEVRGSVIFSTILVVLVFMPLFALGNIEGRLLAPLGIAYIVALIASTIVAVTVTVALSYILLPKSKLVLEDRETWLTRTLKKHARPIILMSIRRAKMGVIIAGASVVLTGMLVVQAGKEFLPPFNEGTLTIGVALPPGASLEGSLEKSSQVERALLGIPEVISTARRTGRAEEDEHANGVNISEFEVDVDTELASKDEVISKIKAAFGKIDLGGANVSIGQPISHRIEHILSGVRAPLVIKLFGPDLDELQTYGEQVRTLLDNIPGTLNPAVEQEVLVPQLTITPNRERISQYGFEFGEFTEMLEVMLAGEEIGKVFQENRVYKMVLRMDEKVVTDQSKVGSLLVATPAGVSVPLSSLSEVNETEGRSSISHDNGQRRLVISSGILDGDSVTIINELKDRIEKEIDLPDGYFVSYEGTYKSQQESSRNLLFFSLLAFAGIVGALYVKFRSFSLVAQVLINIPVTYVGALIAMRMTGNVISLASLVGLISVLGLAARNGILLIEHWLFKVTEEGAEFGEELIVSGSLNRLTPMLMTSLTSMLALIPLMLAPDEPGKEILYPLAVVTFGGLLTSTLVEIVIRPGMFALFGRKPVEKIIRQNKEDIS